MSNELKPKTTPPRWRPIWIAFVVAGVGIILLDEAATSLLVHAFTLLLAMQIFVGLACVAFGVLWGAKRI